MLRNQTWANIKNEIRNILLNILIDLGAFIIK